MPTSVGASSESRSTPSTTPGSSNIDKFQSSDVDIIGLRRVLSGSALPRPRNPFHAGLEFRGLAAEILRNCRAVLPPRGRVLIIEFVLPDIIDRQDHDLERRLMSDLNMLAVTQGKERSALDWNNLLDRAGFRCEQTVSVKGDLVSVIEARPL